MAYPKNQIPWNFEHIAFGSVSDDGKGQPYQADLDASLIGESGEITTIGILSPLSFSMSPNLTDEQQKQLQEVIFPQRYVMYLPQPPAEPIARAIFASKADADQYLSGETVQVEWQALENGQWVDYGEVSFRFQKYVPPAENE